MKARIHFAHANGMPSQCYQKMFDALSDQFEVSYIPYIGIDPHYPVTQQWTFLVQQVIDSIEAQADGEKVIAVGHSLGALLSLIAAQYRPDLIKQVIMLDPPLIVGVSSFVLHLAKYLTPKYFDQVTPAGLSAKRREHWASREDAAQSLRPRGFFKDLDQDCFDAYIQYGLKDDQIRGGVTLTIPRDTEVKIFRSMPSYWWLPQKKPNLPIDLIVGQASPFFKQKLPQAIYQKLAIPYHVVAGEHMFPLQYPRETAINIKKLVV